MQRQYEKITSFFFLSRTCLLMCVVYSLRVGWQEVGKAEAKIERKAQDFKKGYNEGYTSEKNKH